MERVPPKPDGGQGSCWAFCIFAVGLFTNFLAVQNEQRSQFLKQQLVFSSQPGVLPSHNKRQLCSCSQKLEAVSRAKGERTVTWSPWKLKHCHALSRVSWQGLEKASLHFKRISPPHTFPWRGISSDHRDSPGTGFSHWPPRAGRRLCGSTWWGAGL